MSNPPIGRPLVMHYGDATGLFTKNGDSIRLGFEPKGVCVVLAGPNGEFPIVQLMPGVDGDGFFLNRELALENLFHLVARGMLPEGR